MTDARAREQLRQERVAFEQAHDHDKAWFRLRLAVGYLAPVLMLLILGMAFWVLMHPATYGALPVGAAAIAMTSQTLALGFGIARMVLQQPNAARLDPLTSVRVKARPSFKRAVVKPKSGESS
jgi:hypothetical protein